MEAYLKLFERSNDQELTSNNIEGEARRCVILAIKVPNVVDFAETLKLNAVKFLKGKSQEVFDFMSLFTSTTCKEFAEKVKQYQKLIDGEKL